MSESDNDFVERMFGYIKLRTNDFNRLKALARRGADAAEEIERLRAALESIKDMTDAGTETATWHMTSAIHNVNVIARAALEGE